MNLFDLLGLGDEQVGLAADKLILGMVNFKSDLKNEMQLIQQRLQDMSSSTLRVGSGIVGDSHYSDRGLKGQKAKVEKLESSVQTQALEHSRFMGELEDKIRPISKDRDTHFNSSLKLSAWVEQLIKQEEERVFAIQQLQG
ncbi:hypothetical protein JCGZ_18603 [Jatropha curcas]|uniref:Uncharacterized protein n=1 Tax=Jatropha curcas TaxID=180498 RepID=A0A067K1L4_JATCU|nr:hypothetical protein JCGZ_18603 [Jatropha curcas]